MRHIIHVQLRPVMLFPANDAPVGQMYICFPVNMMLAASPVNPKQLCEVAWLCYVINLGSRVTQLRRFPRKPRQMCLCFPVNMMLAALPVNPKQLCEAAWYQARPSGYATLMLPAQAAPNYTQLFFCEYFVSRLLCQPQIIF